MIVLTKAVRPVIPVGAFWMEQHVRVYIRPEMDVVVAEPISVRFCGRCPCTLTEL